MKGAHIGFFMLDKIYTENMKAVVRAEKKKMPNDKVQHLRECTIRSFLLYLLGATLFTNKSMQYVDVIFLTYLQDISLVNTWNWGASGLAYMYNYLDAASRPRCGNLGGYNAMFHAWILSHFERFGSRYVDVNYSHNDPIAAKYYPFKGGKYPTEHRTTLGHHLINSSRSLQYGAS
ncbi:protein MAIN-LIKE 1-like [Trifolium pratense]|uniref:protein MAIN-LIKE 1-like n=1 Tax=Trifolium pratense TaxID=57577 RepID=UPI001E6953E9|nr:protein MAIN-LIKE 1-like [Trifolium pratense]